MSKAFGVASTTDEVLDGVNLHGKRILITGVSAGLGLETARALAAHGAQIIGLARDIDKARKVRGPVDAAVKSGGGSFELMPLDLGSLTGVRTCADGLSKAGKKLDIIIANAGLMGTPFGKTQDGFEIQFGTNHLGHFVLINHLVPMLKPGTRVVSLTSSGHRFSDVDLDDPNFERTPYNDFVSYGRSKTANVLFAVEFDRRHRANGIRATAVHPGSIRTELSRHLSAEVIASYAIPSDPAEAFAQGYKSIPQGAATSVWAAVVAPADTVGGRYCEDCHVAEIDPDPKAQRGVAAYAVDPDRAKALWTASERLVGERY